MPNSFEKYFFEKFRGMAGLDMFREVLKQRGGNEGMVSIGAIMNFQYKV
jgi:hypothetical protein